MIDDPQHRYEHGPTCVPDDLTPALNPDILECTECAGMFNAETKEGLLIMDPRIV